MLENLCINVFRNKTEHIIEWNIQIIKKLRILKKDIIEYLKDRIHKYDAKALLRQIPKP